VFPARTAVVGTCSTAAVVLEKTRTVQVLSQYLVVAGFFFAFFNPEQTHRVTVTKVPVKRNNTKRALLWQLTVREPTFTTALPLGEARQLCFGLGHLLGPPQPTCSSVGQSYAGGLPVIVSLPGGPPFAQPAAPIEVGRSPRPQTRKKAWARSGAGANSGS